MDLVQLRYFVSVARLKSFTKASEELHIAQPAVTRQILLLEEELGARLLYRHRRGAEPTEAGLRLVAGAESIFRLVQDVRADVAASSNTVAGTLRIGFPPSLGGLVIGTVTATFQQVYPAARFDLHEGLGNELRDALLADRLDFAVTTKASNPLLVCDYLCDEELWVLQAKSEADSGGPRPYTLRELAGQPLIQPHRTHLVRQIVEEEAARQGLALNVKVETEALHVTKDLVRRGVGAHISPYSGISAEIKRGEFDGGPVIGLLLSRYLVRRIDRPISLGVIKFHEILVRTLESLSNTGGGIRLPARSLRGATPDET